MTGLTIDDTLRRLEEVEVPEFPIADVERFVLDRFGLSGRLISLKSEFDQMYRCEVRPGDEYIIRISASSESVETLEFQQAVLCGIARSDPELPVPRQVQSTCGRLVEYMGSDTSNNAVRVFNCLDGIPIKDTKKSLAQRESLGKTLARLDKALATVSHPSVGNTLLWDFRQASLFRPLVELSSSTSQRRVFADVLDEADSVVNTTIPSLRQQVIHFDYNVKNVLVDPNNTSEITGIIDFGDALRTALVADISIAICRYPVEEAAQMLAAYHSVNPLSAIEIQMIYYLVCTRLCMASLVQTWRVSRSAARSQNMGVGVNELNGLLDTIRSAGFKKVTRLFLDACQLSAG